MYHRRFFSDIRHTTLLILGLWLGAEVVTPVAILAIPWVALAGACQTAFNANYLIMARHYARQLERYLNTSTGTEVLVAHQVEDVYLFPLDQPRLVTLGFGSAYSWFGWMTAFYTLSGIGAYFGALWWGWSLLAGAAGAAYLAVLGVLTVGALATGLWWFPGGAGESRLRTSLAGIGRLHQPTPG
jgi:hypothetical protein